MGTLTVSVTISPVIILRYGFFIKCVLSLFILNPLLLIISDINGIRKSISCEEEKIKSSAYRVYVISLVDIEFKICWSIGLKMIFARAGLLGAPCGRIPLCVHNCANAWATSDVYPIRWKTSNTWSILIEGKKLWISIHSTWALLTCISAFVFIECCWTKPWQHWLVGSLFSISSKIQRWRDFNGLLGAKIILDFPLV